MIDTENKTVGGGGSKRGYWLPNRVLGTKWKYRNCEFLNRPISCKKWVLEKETLKNNSWVVSFGSLLN